MRLGCQGQQNNRAIDVGISSTHPKSPDRVAANTWLGRYAIIGELKIPTIAVAVAHPNVEGPDFLIVSEGRAIQEVYVRDLSPTVTESLRVLLNEEAEGEFQSLLGDVANRVTVEMTKLGYSPP